MKASTEFKINTLRRRADYLIKKVEGDDSTNAKRFNNMEIDALQSGMTALEKEDQFDELVDVLIQMMTAVEMGTGDELAAAVEKVHNVVDKYQI